MVVVVVVVVEDGEVGGWCWGVLMKKARSLGSYDDRPDGSRRAEGRALFFGAMTAWRDLRMKD